MRTIAGRSRQYPIQYNHMHVEASHGYTIGRDALTNIFREFWPDIAVHVLPRHP